MTTGDDGQDGPGWAQTPLERLAVRLAELGAEARDLQPEMAQRVAAAMEGGTQEEVADATTWARFVDLMASLPDMTPAMGGGRRS